MEKKQKNYNKNSRIDSREMGNMVGLHDLGTNLFVAFYSYPFFIPNVLRDFVYNRLTLKT